MSDYIDRQAALEAIRHIEEIYSNNLPTMIDKASVQKELMMLPSAQPEIIRCKDCKHNPKDTWFECPMAHLSEKQRPDYAWCWKGERREDGSDRQTGGD